MYATEFFFSAKMNVKARGEWKKNREKIGTLYKVHTMKIKSTLWTVFVASIWYQLSEGSLI